MYCLKLSDVRFLNVRSDITVKQLNEKLIINLKRALADKKSFLHLKDADDTVPKKGAAELLKALTEKNADRNFCIGWLSVLHLNGIKDSIFTLACDTEKKDEQKLEPAIDTTNHDGFLDNGAKLMKAADVKGRKSYGWNQKERVMHQIKNY